MDPAADRIAEFSSPRDVDCHISIAIDVQEQQLGRASIQFSGLISGTTRLPTTQSHYPAGKKWMARWGCGRLYCQPNTNQHARGCVRRQYRAANGNTRRRRTRNIRNYERAPTDERSCRCTRHTSSSSSSTIMSVIAEWTANGIPVVAMDTQPQLRVPVGRDERLDFQSEFPRPGQTLVGTPNHPNVPIFSSDVPFRLKLTSIMLTNA
jgi:hypothetical protein